MFAPVARMKSPLTLLAVATLAVSPLAGCFTITGALVGSSMKTDEVTHRRALDGTIVADRGNHAVAGLVLGAVLDAALLGATIAVENAASSWSAGPIFCTDDHVCY
jgi:hypothetical protein